MEIKRKHVTGDWTHTPAEMPLELSCDLTRVSATVNGTVHEGCCDCDDGSCTGDSRQTINKCALSADASKQARWEPAIMKLALSKDYLGRNVLGAG